MSIILSERNGIKAHKAKRCCFCGERIEVGELKDVRVGVESGDMWTMNMHPECHRYEQTPEVRRRLHNDDWYEDISEPAFERSEAIQGGKL